MTDLATEKYRIVEDWEDTGSYPDWFHVEHWNGKRWKRIYESPGKSDCVACIERIRTGPTVLPEYVFQVEQPVYVKHDRFDLSDYAKEIATAVVFLSILYEFWIKGMLS